MFSRDAVLIKSVEIAQNGLFLNKISTPSVIVGSYMGNPSYTTPDSLNEIQSDYIAQLEIADLCHKDFTDTSLRVMKKDIPNLSTVLSARNMVNNVATSDSNGISIDTFGGRHHISVENYLARVKLDKPEVVIAMADEVNITSGRKRLTKSIERSSTWFKTLVASSTISELKTNESEKSPKIFVFGVAIAIPELPDHVGKFSKDLLVSGANGVVVGSAHMGESEEQRVQIIKSIRSAVGSEVPLLIQGADSIRDILLALRHGVDLVSTNYPALVTSRGYAISYGARRVLKTDKVVVDGVEAVLSEVVEMTHGKRGLSKIAQTIALTEEDDEEETSKPSTKKAKVDQTTSVSTATDIISATVEGREIKPRPKHNQKLNSCNTSKNNTNQHKPISQCDATSDAKVEQCVVDLWDKRYQKDTQPLVVGCRCHACQHHTRAYLHHLLIAREMLAEVLLYHHNQHQIMELFRESRENIAAGTFAEWSEQRIQELK